MNGLGEIDKNTGREMVVKPVFGPVTGKELAVVASTPAAAIVAPYPQYGTPEYEQQRAIDSDKTMSLVIRFPGMFLAGVGQWVLNRTRDTKNYVDPMTYAADETNKNLTWALALVAWGGIGWGVYTMFFKKGGN